MAAGGAGVWTQREKEQSQPGGAANRRKSRLWLTFALALYGSWSHDND
jgi:hypothetical protein